MQFDDIAGRRYKALMIVGISLPFLLFTFFEVVFVQKGQSFNEGTEKVLLIFKIEKCQSLFKI